jgi:sialidase-1
MIIQSLLFVVCVLGGDLDPIPEPPTPAPTSGLLSRNVFWRGQQASDGTVYPCIRIPSLLQAGSGVQLAFAECRLRTGDGCFPPNIFMSGHRDVCMRRSVDGGDTWGPLTVVAPNASQNTPVYDPARRAVVLNLLTASNHNAQVVSHDDGLTWGPLEPLSPFLGGLDGSLTGPGVGLRLSNTNPHHPGRLLFIGHHGAYVEDVVWFSDDGGKTYNLSSTPSGYTFPRMDEAQLVELENGDVIANMRNDIKQPSGGSLRGVAFSTDGGSSFSSPSFDPSLVEPVCMASILRAAPPLGDGNVYFSNPGQATGRVNGLVRRSRGCGAETCTWDGSLVIDAGAPFGYSCLGPINTTHMGLLWETNAEPCYSNSSACLLVFSVIPLSAFN